MAIKGTFVYSAEDAIELQWTNSTGATVTAGTMVDLGTCFARAVADIASLAVGTVEAGGVFKIAKNTGISFVAGEQVAFDMTNNRCDKVGTANAKVAGIAYQSAASADTTMLVAVNVPRSGQSGSTKIVVSSGQAAANSANGQVTFDTGLGANLRTYQVMVLNSSGVLQTFVTGVAGGYTITDSAGVITISGAGSGVQLDAGWIVHIWYSA
jgi:predicted RecA/RadA family phage recombinase